MSVVEFKGGKVESDSRLVETLENMLEEARAGKINAIAAITFHRQTHYGRRYCHNSYCMEGIGMAYMMLAWLREKWEDVPSVPDPPDEPS